MPEGLPRGWDQDDIEKYEDGLREEDEERGTEDPLKGDVDRHVPAEETRTDEEIERDRKHAVEPYDDEEDDDVEDGDLYQASQRHPGQLGEPEDDEPGPHDLDH